MSEWVTLSPQGQAAFFFPSLLPAPGVQAHVWPKCGVQGTCVLARVFFFFFFFGLVKLTTPGGGWAYRPPGSGWGKKQPAFGHAFCDNELAGLKLCSKFIHTELNQLLFAFSEGLMCFLFLCV